MLRTVFDQRRTAAPDQPFPRDAFLDSLKLTCAAALFVSPWVFAFTPVATWNLWVSGYAVLTITLAALVAEADWEPRANFWLGAWIIAAPWILGFSGDPDATFVHMAGGGMVSILSAVELWTAERNPPWRFRPGAAVRASRTPATTEMPQARKYQAMHTPAFARRRASALRRTRLSRLRKEPVKITIWRRRWDERMTPVFRRGDFRASSRSAA